MISPHISIITLGGLVAADERQLVKTIARYGRVDLL